MFVVLASTRAGLKNVVTRATAVFVYIYRTEIAPQMTQSIFERRGSERHRIAKRFSIRSSPRSRNKRFQAFQKNVADCGVCMWAKKDMPDGGRCPGPVETHMPPV
jgi:hypothetical protein